MMLGKSEDARAWRKAGAELTAKQRYPEARASYQQALLLCPDDVEALFNLANLQVRLLQYQAALVGYEKLLQLQPMHLHAMCNRGNVLQLLGRYQEALLAYQHVLTEKPDHHNALCNCGSALQALGRHAEALSRFGRALQIRPDDAEALCNRGIVLHSLQQDHGARASLERALELKPDHAHAAYNLGNVLQSLDHYEEALQNYRLALKLRPDHADTYYNLGCLFQKMNRPHDAIATFELALQQEPGMVKARFNAGLSYLLCGEMDEGLAAYELRWQQSPLQELKRDFKVPLWLGDDVLVGKKILIHAEQGLGDTIQFCRYLNLVAGLGASVFFEVPVVLYTLCARLAGVELLLCQGTRLPEFDFHCPLMSLPLAFKTNRSSIPATGAYLDSPAWQSNQWATRLGPRTRPRVGLAWSGNPGLQNDRNRSIALADLSRLFLQNVEFISLQKDVRPDDRIVLEQYPMLRPCGESLGDFADTAALISCLDLVIAVDTSVAHLAGALGKPVWVLLPFAPDWRWMLDSPTSPWYATARLFRQPRLGDWDSVLGQLALELAALK